MEFVCNGVHDKEQLLFYLNKGSEHSFHNWLPAANVHEYT